MGLGGGFSHRFPQISTDSSTVCPQVFGSTCGRPLRNGPSRRSAISPSAGSDLATQTVDPRRILSGKRRRRSHGPHSWHVLSRTADSSSVCPFSTLQPDEQRRRFRSVDRNTLSKADSSNRSAFAEFGERKGSLVHRRRSFSKRNLRIHRASFRRRKAIRGRIRFERRLPVRCADDVHILRCPRFREGGDSKHLSRRSKRKLRLRRAEPAFLTRASGFAKICRMTKGYGRCLYGKSGQTRELSAAAAVSAASGSSHASPATRMASAAESAT